MATAACLAGVRSTRLMPTSSSMPLPIRRCARFAVARVISYFTAKQVPTCPTLQMSLWYQTVRTLVDPSRLPLCRRARAHAKGLCPACAAVVAPFDVFNDVTFELSKINLQGARASALGARMGATVWSFDARSGADGPALNKPWRGEQEFVYYDSTTAKRTCLGYCFNVDCCFAPIYKVTSERVLYTECAA